MNRHIIACGGVVLSIKAHAVCGCCTEFEDYAADPESVSLEQFADAATEHFRGKGWEMGPGVAVTLCPGCAEDKRTPYCDRCDSDECRHCPPPSDDHPSLTSRERQ